MCIYIYVDCIYEEGNLWNLPLREVTMIRVYKPVYYRADGTNIGMDPHVQYGRVERIF